MRLGDAAEDAGAFEPWLAAAKSGVGKVLQRRGHRQRESRRTWQRIGLDGRSASRKNALRSRDSTPREYTLTKPSNCLTKQDHLSVRASSCSQDLSCGLKPRTVIVVVITRTQGSKPQTVLLADSAVNRRLGRCGRGVSSGGLRQHYQRLAEFQSRQGVALAVGAEVGEGLLALRLVGAGEGALVAGGGEVAVGDGQVVVAWAWGLRRQIPVLVNQIAGDAQAVVLARAPRSARRVPPPKAS